jgi:hypothetical protein
LWQQVIPEFATGTVYGSFPAIAITAFRRRLMTLDRDAHRIKRGGNATTSAIIDFEHGSDRDDPARIIEENEDARIMLERILQIASPLARKAIPLLLGGYSAAECDAVLGVSPRSTGQSLRILKKTLNLESECIDQLAQNGTVVGRFDTAADAARVTGISERGIGKVLRGEMKHCGEFAWRRGLIRRECRPIDAIAAAEGDAIRHRFVSAITPKMKRQISRK